MRLQKRIAILSGILSFLSITLSVLCHVLSVLYQMNNLEYISNILIGLFSSGILACIIAIMTYFSERNTLLRALYDGCYDYMDTSSTNVTINKVMDIHDFYKGLNAVMNCYKKNIFVYCNQLTGIRPKTRLSKIVSSIGDSAGKLYLRVVDDCDKVHAVLLGDIPPEAIQNHQWKCTDDKSVEYLEDLKEALDSLMYYMNYYNVKKKGTTDNAD